MNQFFDIDKEMAWYKDRPFIATPNKYIKKDVVTAKRKPRPVDHYNEAGQLIKSYDSVGDLAEALGKSKQAVYNYLTPDSPYYRGNEFRYKETVKL